MISFQKALAPILVTVACASLAATAQEATVSSDTVKITSLSATTLADRTRIVVESTSPLSLPSSYNLDPLVLVLDIPGTDSSALQKQYQVGSPCVDRVNVYQLEEGGRKSITRLEILMSSLVPYRIYAEDMRLYVDFEHVEGAAKPAKTQEFFKKPSEQAAAPAPAPTRAQPAAEPAKSSVAGVARVQRIDVDKSTADLQVTVDYRGAIEYKCFELQAPHRLVLDLINAVNAVPTEMISVKYDPVETIRVGQFQKGQPKIARVVFDLRTKPDYDVVQSESQLRIVFRRSAGQSEASAAEPPADTTAPSAPAVVTTSATPESGPAPVEAPVPTEATVTTEAAAEQTAAATDGGAPVDSPAQTAQVVEPPQPASAGSAEVAGDSSEKLPTLQTNRRRGGRKGIEMAEVPAPLQVEEEQPVADAPPLAEEAPPSAAPGTRFESQTISEGEVTYSGEPINLDLVDAPIEQVFRLISEISGLNVITDPGVTGRVTVHFKGVPWDQALDLILKTNGLGYVLENKVVRIAKLDVLAQEEQKKRALREAKLLSVDLKTITRSLSYAKVADMEAVLRKMLSQRGEIITDPRTNTVIISDIPDRVSAIDKLIETLDTATPQVTIQAKIVESSSNYTQNLGVQWGFQGIADARHGNQTSLQFPNNIVIDGSAVGGTDGLVGPLGGYAVNLPAAAFNSGIGISIGNVLDTFRLDAALTALESSGRGRILSAPKISTQNNVKASIIQGREIPVQTTANNTTTTTFKNAALELNVTPQITAEGTIIMLVDIKNDQADFANLVNGIPPIITQKAMTTVLVRDGGTSVIGGIYRAEDSFTENKVPGLHKIPLLGYLFKNSAKNRTNRELLIFLTPRIVRE